METTATLILERFPPARRSDPSLVELAERVDAFTRADAVQIKLDRFIDLFNWVRTPDPSIPEPIVLEADRSAFHEAAWRREHVWACVLEGSPELRERYREAIGVMLQETAGTSLFARSGMPNDRGLFSEAADRITRRILPEPRDNKDLSRLLPRLFPTKREVDRFFDIPPELLDRVISLAAPPEDSPVWKRPVESLLEAFCLLAARVQGLGLSEKVRERCQESPVQESPFYRLPRVGDQLIEAVRWRESVNEAAQNWKAVASECRAELDIVANHLETKGVNLDVVYAMDLIDKSLTRMGIIVGVLVAPPGVPKRVTASRLLREVIRGRINDRSVRTLFHNSFRLLARKIVEWAGKTGEHYIANNREEYFQMWKAALGGGLLTVGTAAIKMMVTHHGLPLFVEGFLAGLNYAVSFVLLQTFHLALATKQPSMTGAALAKIIHNCRDRERSDELVNFAARIVRTQLAAALGNILAVGLGCIAFDALWRTIFHAPYLSQELAEYAVHSLNPIHTGTVFYAIVTGVILWLSSLAGGWIENWSVYHQLPLALAEHKLGENFEPETTARLANSFARNIAGWGGSIALGFMLGMAPVIGQFFGIPVDVRHVTLSTGTLALGLGSLGWAAVGRGTLIWAAVGIACMFFFNLSVSFYLALRLAMRAQDISTADHLAIRRTFFRRLRESPRDFFFPPADSRPGSEVEVV